MVAGSNPAVPTNHFISLDLGYHTVKKDIKSNRGDGNILKILVLGCTGMLGYSLFKNLSLKENLHVFGTLRCKEDYRDYFSKDEIQQLSEFNALNDIQLLKPILEEIRPDYILNCIGSISQKHPGINELIELNSVYPHKLAHLINETKCKIVHFSTDCVFNGLNGGYSEEDISDARDLYGKSKFLGEIIDKKNITLRTSIIGHELLSNASLVDWFLSQEDEIGGYENVIFSGFPCAYFSKILVDNIFPNPDLYGLYHVASDPISKYDLLHGVSIIYKKNISIIKNTEYYSDKSLDSSKFRKATNFSPPSWNDLLTIMYEDYKKFYIGN